MLFAIECDNSNQANSTTCKIVYHIVKCSPSRPQDYDLLTQFDHHAGNHK